MLKKAVTTTKHDKFEGKNKTLSAHCANNLEADDYQPLKHHTRPLQHENSSWTHESKKLSIVE